MSFQYRYKNEAATSLPASSEVAMITTAQNAPSNMLARPYILKNAADPAMLNVVNNNIVIKNLTNTFSLRVYC